MEHYIRKQRKDTLIFVPLNIGLLRGLQTRGRQYSTSTRHERILIRSHNDNNCLFGDPATDSTIELFKVPWRMLHMLLSEINKLLILRALENGYLSISFCLWDLCEYPLLQNMTEYS